MPLPQINDALRRELNRVKPDLGDRMDETKRGGIIRRRNYGAPAAANATAILASTAQPASGSTTVITASQPDAPRCLVVTGTQATCTGTVVVNGTAADGSLLFENFVLAGTAAQNGLRAFRSISSIVIPQRGAAGDAITVGTQNKFGVDDVLFRNSIIMATAAGVYEATRPTVVFDPELAKNTITFNTTPNGASQLIVWYIAETD